MPGLLVGAVDLRDVLDLCAKTGLEPLRNTKVPARGSATPTGTGSGASWGGTNAARGPWPTQTLNLVLHPTVAALADFRS
jgi:hypothetical protein